MQVETYEIEEKDEMTQEIEHEAINLINTLELTGQKELINRTDTTTERFQYPEMTASEYNIYSAIFPLHTMVDKYSAGILPVRVLQVIAHAKTYCDFIQVWHKKIHDPDPLLIGLKSKAKNEYNIDNRYVLARWGDSLKSFAELTKEARITIKREFEKTIKEKLTKAKSDLENLDTLVDAKLNGESVWVG